MSLVAGPDGATTAAGTDQVIMIIRHGEKPLPRHHERGITEAGRRDKRSLTVDGWKRAGALVELLAPAAGEPPGSLRRPDAVYGSAAEHGRSKRSLQTVAPVAERVGVEVVDRYGPGQEAKLAKELAKRSGASLVSWHHHSVGKIIKHLGPVSPPPPRHWPDDRYDVVWTLTRDGDGWRFEHVPQMVLPRDDPEPIAT